MGQAVLIRPQDEEVVTAPVGGLASGQILQCESGKAGVVQGLQAVAEGQTAIAKTSGTFRVSKLTTAVFTGGDIVDWDETDEEAKVAGGGDYPIGRAAQDYANPSTEMDVLFNDPGASFADTT